MRAIQEKRSGVAIKAKQVPQTMLLHMWMSECRLRITVVKLWFGFKLEECNSAELGGVGGGALAMVKHQGRRERQPAC
jgi:hypothetical protein